MSEPRCLVFYGGPYDGAEEWIVPTLTPRALVELCHLTDVAYHTYRSEVPVDFYGPLDAIVIVHDPGCTRPRAESHPS